MQQRVIQLAPYAVALVLAVVGGMVAMQVTQQRVSVLPGLRGCESLAKHADQVDCVAAHYQEQLEALPAGIGDDERAARVERIVARADGDVDGSPVLGSACHPAMHVIGRAEGARLGAAGAVPTYPAEPDRLCTAGYVHGLAEGYLADARDPDLAAVYPALCGEPGAAAGCAHGIGHALVRRAAGEGRDRGSFLPSAIERCGELPRGRFADCTNGIFMEHAMATDPAVPLDEYATTCASQPRELLARSCAVYLPVNAAINELPQAEVGRVCARSLEGEVAALCVQAHGRNLGVDRVAACGDVGGAALVERCINGALALQLRSGHVTAGDARRACEELGGFAAACRAEVGRLAGSAGPARGA